MAARRSNKKAIRFRNKGETPLAPRGLGSRADLTTVAQELQESIAEAMTRSGVSKKEQIEAFQRALRGRKLHGRPAKLLLERSHAVSDLLSFWQKNARYIDNLGAPRVLPIYGRGVTLESLARQFVPDMRVSEVVAAIVRHAEVAQLAGDKVALVGTIVVVTPRTPELTLAAITLNTQRLMRTILHNASLPEGQKGLGRFHRDASGRLTASDFTLWLEKSRPDLQKNIVANEASLRSGESKRRKGKSSGVVMFVYRDE